MSRKRRMWSAPRFTVKAVLVSMLVIGLAVGWLTDRQRLESRLGILLQQEQERRATVESRLRGLSSWYAANHSLEDLPRELRTVVAESPTEVVDPETGFRLFRVREASRIVANLGLDGNAFRIRGGPLRFEFVAEDLSGDEPRVIYRHVGPENAASENTDGILSFSSPRSLFKPWRVGTPREPLDELYRFGFSQPGPFRPVSVHNRDVWPEWVFSEEPLGGPMHGHRLGERVVVIPADRNVTLFSKEVVAKDGRKARVRLMVSCRPRI